MELNCRQKGNLTYPRDMFRWIFEDNLEIFLRELIQSVDKAPKFSYRVETYKDWTMYGPAGVVDFRYSPAPGKTFSMHVGCYQDGWHITCSKFNDYDIKPEKRLEIFGDHNRSTMWTQETELVPKMINELIEKIDETSFA